MEECEQIFKLLDCKECPHFIYRQRISFFLSGDGEKRYLITTLLKLFNVSLEETFYCLGRDVIRYDSSTNKIVFPVNLKKMIMEGSAVAIETTGCRLHINPKIQELLVKFLGSRVRILDGSPKAV